MSSFCFVDRSKQKIISDAYENSHHIVLDNNVMSTVPARALTLTFISGVAGSRVHLSNSVVLTLLHSNFWERLRHPKRSSAWYLSNSPYRLLPTKTFLRVGYLLSKIHSAGSHKYFYLSHTPYWRHKIDPFHLRRTLTLEKGEFKKSNAAIGFSEGLDCLQTDDIIWIKNEAFCEHWKQRNYVLNQKKNWSPHPK